MAKSKNNEILMTRNGFFIGHLLKNGELNKGARRITEGEIMNMFMHMFSAYCAKNNTKTLLLKGDNGYMMLAKEFSTEVGEEMPQSDTVH